MRSAAVREVRFSSKSEKVSTNTNTRLQVHLGSRWLGASAEIVPSQNQLQKLSSLAQRVATLPKPSRMFTQKFLGARIFLFQCCDTVDTDCPSCSITSRVCYLWLHTGRQSFFSNCYGGKAWASLPYQHHGGILRWIYCYGEMTHPRGGGAGTSQGLMKAGKYTRMSLQLFDVSVTDRKQTSIECDSDWRLPLRLKVSLWKCHFYFSCLRLYLCTMSFQKSWVLLWCVNLLFNEWIVVYMYVENGAKRLECTFWYSMNKNNYIRRQIFTWICMYV